MSAENNTQPSTTQQSTSDVVTNQPSTSPSPNANGLINMNNIFKNLLESMTMPPPKNSNTKDCCDQDDDEDDDEDDEEEENNEDEEDEEDDDEDDDGDTFEADTDFRWKTLGELVESHNKLSQAFLKMVKNRDD